MVSYLSKLMHKLVWLSFIAHCLCMFAPLCLYLIGLTCFLINQVIRATLPYGTQIPGEKLELRSSKRALYQHLPCLMMENILPCKYTLITLYKQYARQCTYKLENMIMSHLWFIINPTIFLRVLSVVAQKVIFP